ncbi:MAG: VWA domain-containing protein [Paracoccaceae bacterium]
MNDDLDDLKAIMDSVTPRPDAARRADNLALAQKNFDDLQGSRDGLRPTPVTEAKGLWTGVKTMLNTFTTKGGLTATTALVAVGFLYIVPQVMDGGPESRARDLGTDLIIPTAEPAAPVPIPPTISQIDPQLRDSNADKIGESFAHSPGQPTVNQEAPQVEMAELAAPKETEIAPTERQRVEPLREITPPQVRNRNVDFQGFGIEGEQTEGVAPDAALSATVSPAPEDRLDLNTTGSARIGLGYAPDGIVQKRPTEDLLIEPQSDTETFSTETPNALKITSTEPVSTFSIDVDTAAYSVVRSSLNRGQHPPTQAVRIEELINYFPYDYPTPDTGEAPFRPTVSTFQTPWNTDTQLVHIALQGQMPALEDRPPLNLVFLIDTSGSMNQPDKLPLLKQSFRLMLDQLRPQDEVAIVAYAGSAGQVLAPTPASDRSAIIDAIDTLRPGGGTNGQGGLQQAYAMAEAMSEDAEVGRILLATDGDFNVGINSPDALKDFIADKRDTGTYLSVLGFGRGNLDDATMQALAQNGNGTAAYIDTLSEAQKVLVDQLSGALFPIAGDVKVQVEFNPAQIAEYRLIGYETRALAREDFNNDKVDAGELGAGHAVTAIYEVTPVGSPAQLSDPLRYAPNTVASQSDEIGFVKLRYKEPGEDVSQLLETPIVGQSIPGTEANFAAAIAGFGQLLRDDRYLGDWGYDDAIALANANRGEDAFGYRTEAVQLMRLAQSLSR